MDAAQPLPTNEFGKNGVQVKYKTGLQGTKLHPRSEHYLQQSELTSSM